MKLMEEQENKVIVEINKACHIKLKPMKNERMCMTPRLSYSRE